MTLITDILTINEGKGTIQNILIGDGMIEKISTGRIPVSSHCRIINGAGKVLMPGVIDDQVHFREPGLTHKGEIYTESRAAVAGGITSYMEMPNTIPQATTQKHLEEKYQLASEKSIINYSFFMGATNDNIEELLKTPLSSVCGIKVFMGSSTGNMLVNNPKALDDIFSQSKHLIAVHCEDEEEINKNTAEFKEKYGEDVPINQHPKIRSEEACYKSSAKAVALAKKFGTRLHVLHISTAKELELFSNDKPSAEKQITAEVCIHHLWFSEEDYDKKGTFIKWNPAVKTADDRSELFKAMKDGRIDVIATDHAPHTIAEKENTYFKAPSGGPMVQHALLAMLEFNKKGEISLTQIVDKMCHKPAEIFKIHKRGFIREGYFADLVIVEPNSPNPVTKESLHYKCGWSPFEGHTFDSKISHTFVNGNLVYENGVFQHDSKGMRLVFDKK